MADDDDDGGFHGLVSYEWMVPYLFLLLILGTLGNGFSVLLFSSSSMRKYSCSSYFFLLAIFDELTLIWWVANRLTRELTHVQFRNRSTFLCKLFVFTYYTSSQASIGMLVLAMLDRLYTSIHIAYGHFDIRLIRHRRHFKHICLCIFFFLLLGLNGVLFGSRLIVAPDGETTCVIIDMNINKVYVIIDLWIYAILPCILMLIGDVLILYYIQRSRALVTQSLDNSKKRREKQLSVMLVITSLVSLFIVSPYSVLNLMANFSAIYDIDFRTMITLNDVFGLLSTLTHGIHFYLFLLISSTIRKQSKQLLASFINNCCHRSNIVHPIVSLSMSTTSSQPTIAVIERQQY